MKRLTMQKIEAMKRLLLAKIEAMKRLTLHHIASSLLEPRFAYNSTLLIITQRL
jgi:hypothetical protein